MVLLDQQIALAWSKAARRPRSIERQEYNRLMEQKQALAKKQGEHQDLLRSIDRQLALIP
jgi:recombinational DNA repair ATPase RecF